MQKKVDRCACARGQESKSPGARRAPAARLLAAFAALAICIAAAFAGQALGDTSRSASDFRLPTDEAFQSAIEGGTKSVKTAPLTDASAAEELPHRDLDRQAALELLQEVFEPVLEQTEGVFAEPEPEKFLGPTAALVSQEDQRAAQDEDEQQTATKAESAAPSRIEEKREIDEQEQAGRESEASSPRPEESTELTPSVSGNAVLESTLPLKASTGSGMAPVDLGLARDPSGLKAKNPLVSVEIPSELGEGIELPGADVSVNLQNAPENRAPTTDGSNLAFYPNISQDTDFAVAAVPTGVETFTQLRSADSPDTQTLTLEMQAGDQLESTQGGGAEIVRDGKPIVSVEAPTAIDATGASVPVEMTVEGHSLDIKVSPEPGTVAPILVDPLFEVDDWTPETVEGEEVAPWWNNPLGDWETHYGERWSPEVLRHPGEEFHLCAAEGCNHTEPVGLYVNGVIEEPGGKANTTPWDRGDWLYTVPRFFSDQEKYNGAIPTSYIARMVLSHIQWQALSNYNSPYALMALYSISAGNWTSYATKTGLLGHNVNEPLWAPEFPGNGSAIAAYVGVEAMEAVPAGNRGELDVQTAFIELGDNEPPQTTDWLPAEGKWVRNAMVPVEFTATDTGLGVKSISAFYPSNILLVKKSYPCTGAYNLPCPRKWQSEEAAHPVLEVNPSNLPTGADVVQIQAEDAVGNKSASGAVEIDVDHTAPQISLTGTATEQAALGTRRPTYVIAATATDGTTASPQSGAAKETIEFDGAEVKKVETGCGTRNCSKTLEWSIEAAKYSPGTHTIKVTAEDAVGNQSPPQELKITLNPSPPALTLSGTMTEQGSLGTSRPRYMLKAAAAAEAGIEVPPSVPTYVSSFGSAGTGNGQFAHPADVALDAKGNLWVPDENNNRLEEFNEKGEFLKALGTTGTGNGQFTRPKSIAFAANGNFWVADSGNSRLEEFNEKGEFLKAVGSQGAGNGQFSGAEGIAIDAKGNIWVADTYNYRVQELNEKGEFLKVVNPSGLGAIEPTGLDVGPGGNVWVADWAHSRVVEFSETGALVRQFGSEGAGNGQFKRPDAITVDPKGNVWVGDQNNSRIQEFNQRGEYLTQFGSPGSGAGQFSFSYPLGIAADLKGDLWIADSNNNRVQKWRVPNAYGYLGSIGSAGTGTGKFNHPADVAFDGKGNFWVVDKANNRIQEFNEKGVFVRTAGSAGSTGGKLNSPSAVAVDSSNNVWVADTANNRIEEFSETGAFVAVIGKDVNKTKVEAAASEAERNYCSAASGNVCQAGPEGTAPGQLKAPQGIAATTGGSLWVADTGHNRLEKYTATGGLLNNSFAGEVKEPTAVAMGPGGSIWAADSGNNRIIEWNSLCQFVRAFGVEGTGNGQFKRPDALEVDSAGNVWVGDEGNNRIEEFSEMGEFVGKFGSAGAGSGQFTFSAPLGIALGNGNLLVTDTNNNRVEKWQPPSHSEISTEITLDGKVVDTGAASCEGEHCSALREWSLPSSGNAGKHTVVVKATDGLGNVTTKTLSIEVQPDTTKPSLETGGSLVKAPEGWVEQEGYGFTASAKDGGYGVTSLALKIDGQQVAASSGACPDGGCEASIQKTINMAPYSGGAHPAEVVATDGAGNVSTERWTINVDPEGHITSAEAIGTLEAADETSESSIVAPASDTLDPQQMEDGDNPGLVKEGASLESTGVPDTTSMTTNPAEGFTIETPEGEVTITPTVSGSSGTVTVASEVAGVAANTGTEADSVVRPEYDGDLTFEAIRSAEGQHTFSWNVHLHGEQHLELISPEYAQVLYPSGVRAFLITAEPAHDAVGATVPTAFSVEGSVLTMNVDLSSPSIVYPVRAGQGWEGGYRAPTIIEFPEDELEEREREQHEFEEREEEREALEAQAEEEYEGGPEPPNELPPPPYTKHQAESLLLFGKLSEDIQPPPAPPSRPLPKGAHVTTLYRSKCGGRCAWFKARVYNAAIITGAENEWSEWEDGTQVHADIVSGTVTGLLPSWVPGNSYEVIFQGTTWNCGWFGPHYVRKGSGEHLSAFAHFTEEIWWVPHTESGSAPVETNWAFQAWVYPNSFQSKHVNKGWGGQPVSHECPTTISY